jgi:hypothetical protein
LALAGSTHEHEAQLAMQRAQELFAKHNLGTFTSPQSSEQFVWLNRRYGETETQLSPSAIMPSTRADSSQNAVI